MFKIKKRKNIYHKILKWTGITIASFLLAVIIITLGARLVVYMQNHINLEQGIDESTYIELGGKEQYIQIRGENINNPIIIYLHGGPASPNNYLSYYWQKYILDKYTFVNWDQRGCGRTYYHNYETDPKNETANYEQALIDLDNLVKYVMNRFDNKNVIILGHSYGTIIGSQYARENPEKVAAYIGVGQVVSMESETYSYKNAIEKAKALGDDISYMEEAYKLYCNDSSLINIMNLRNYVYKYNSVPKEMSSIKTIWLGLSSPYMSLLDIKWFLKPNSGLDKYFEINKNLFDYIITVDLRNETLEYNVPTYFITGECDWITPMKYSQDYYYSISAPAKEYYIMKDCGHAPYFDDPKEFCNILINALSNIK